MTRNLDGPRLRRLILHAIEPWHTDEEADAHEADERRREMELQEILTTRQSQAKQTQSERGESFNDGLTKEVQP